MTNLWEYYSNTLLLNNSLLNYNMFLPSFFVYGFICFSILNILTSHVHDIHSWEECCHVLNTITITITLWWALEIWNFHSNQQAFQLFKEKKHHACFILLKNQPWCHHGGCDKASMTCDKWSTISMTLVIPYCNIGDN
jgi:hypothetical protein